MSEQKTASYGDWDKDFEKKEEKSSGTKTKYMKFEPGIKTVRLAGKYVKFLAYWEPFGKKVITHKSYGDSDSARKAGYYPREFYAIHAIDRADGEVKIIERGRQVFEQFFAYKEVNAVSPNHPEEAPDFVIETVWPKGVKMAAEYKVTAKNKAAPLTPEEREKFKANFTNLEERYKSESLESIKAMWDALPEEKKTPPKKNNDKNTTAKSEPKTESKSEPISEKMDNAPADKEDLFEGEKKDDDLF